MFQREGFLGCHALFAYAISVELRIPYVRMGLRLAVLPVVHAIRLTALLFRG